MTDVHNSLIGESLSAFMDGEVQELELRRLLQDLPTDPEMRGKWSRYHLASSIIQQQNYQPVASLRLADAVQLAVSQIAPPLSSSRLDGAGDKHMESGMWQKNAARFAVAASVAIAVVAGVQWRQGIVVSTQVAGAPRVDVQMNPVKQNMKQHSTSPVLVSQPLISVMLPLQSSNFQNGTYMQYPLKRVSPDTTKSEVLPAK